MSTLELLVREVQDEPEEIILRVLKYARTIKNQTEDELFDTAPISEPALAEIWSTEEDEAWKDLVAEK